ncbi:hypothetical protein WR164_03320 [Philodulcilactobacillus myokoensis]|uniref:30S ribosomal protein S20 n=1 Tax=Philodulcilactobacillus myokoensis TaxID=2929573 RepID=A0A9W6B0E9_9LACO|nr:hypothetical protein [Philodulcilactobacillus myokoensis]GLB46353.1 hypothetical protein WR164_03320 [Philodulcilactobacillus myokoensis]
MARAKSYKARRNARKALRTAYRQEAYSDLKVSKLAKTNKRGYKFAKEALAAAKNSNNRKAKKLANKLVNAYKKLFKAETNLKKAHSKRTKKNARKVLNRTRRNLKKLPKIFNSTLNY